MSNLETTAEDEEGRDADEAFKDTHISFLASMKEKVTYRGRRN